MLRQNSESLIESQIKFINDRVKVTEKYASLLRTTVNDIAIREAELRDKYDEVSKICKDFAESEKLDTTLITALHALSNSFTMLADNKNLEAQRLVVHVESEFAQYATICKKIKEYLKDCGSTKDPVMAVRQRRAGLEMTSNDSKLLKNSVDTKRILNELSDTFETFEQRKVQDFKSTFNNFLLILLKSNTSSLDPLTYSTRAISDVDENLDMKRLKEAYLKLNSDVVSNKIRQNRFRSRSMSALSSLFTKGGKKTMLSQSSTSINSNENLTANKDMRYQHGISDNEDDDDEDDDEDANKSQSESESSDTSVVQESRKKRK